MKTPLLTGALLLSFWMTATGSVRADEPLSVVGRGKAASALLIVGQASGTAFCIDPAGYFVTNHHLVRQSRPGDQFKLVLYPGEAQEKVCMAKLVRVDPQSDLAVLQTKETMTLIALELGDTGGLEETQRLVAFGYPFGDQLALRGNQYPNVSVNAGSITSLRKASGTLEAIQVDAVLNPGNSGGAVIDRTGRVVGIVRAGILGAGVNFVIPVEKLKELLVAPEIDFEPPRISRDTAGRETRFRARPVWLLDGDQTPLEMQLEFNVAGEPVRRLNMQPSSDGFEVAAVPLPSASAPLTVRFNAEFESGAVQGETADASFQIGGETVWLRDLERLTLGPSPQAIIRPARRQLSGPVSGLDAVPVNLGPLQFPLDLSQARQVRVDQPRLPDAVTVIVVARQGDKELSRRTFQIKLDGQMTEVTAGGPPAATATPRVAERSPGVASRSPVPQRASPAGSSVTIPVASETAVPITPPALNGELTVRELPGTINELAVGGGGRFLVLHLGQLRKLAIFDANEARVIHYVPLGEDNIRFAAGNSKLMIALCDTRLIQRWDLATGERELTAPLPVEGVVKSIAMGSASGGPLLMHWASGTGALDRAHFDLVDIQSFKTHRLTAQGHRGTSYRDQTQIRASADGRTFGMWELGVSPGGLQVLVLGESTANTYYEHTSVGHVIPSADGKFICTGTGIYTQQLRRLDRPGSPSSMAIPAHAGGFFLRGTLPSFPSREKSNTTSLSVYMEGDLGQPIATIADLDISPPPASPGRAPIIPVDKRVHFVPSAKLLITIPGTNDRLVLQRFDMEEALEKLGVDYLFVTSSPPATAKTGSLFEYTLSVKAKKGGVNFGLESGPDGMEISPAGVLSWNVPPDLTDQSVSVIVTVSDAAGQERFHSFTLKMER